MLIGKLTLFRRWQRENKKRLNTTNAKSHLLRFVAHRTLTNQVQRTRHWADLAAFHYEKLRKADRCKRKWHKHRLGEVVGLRTSPRKSEANFSEDFCATREVQCTVACKPTVFCIVLNSTKCKKN